MKKILALVFAMMLTLVLASCTKTTTASPTGEPEQTAPAADNKPSEQPNETAKADKGNGNGKILVAYFSCTGNTKKLAETLADAVNADLYEITPAQPYSDADLDWHNKESRSSVEHQGDTARPEINGKVENMADYDVVFVGYPIWWAEAPRIVYTFMEGYDFNGKTVIPFCTSGGSPIGESGKNLEKLTKGANWREGKLFPPAATKEDILIWTDTLNLPK